MREPSARRSRRRPRRLSLNRRGSSTQRVGLRLYYNVVANRALVPAALPLDLPYRRRSTRAPPAFTRATSLSPRFLPTRFGGAPGAARDGPSSPYHLSSRRASCATSTRGALAPSSTSRGAVRLLLLWTRRDPRSVHDALRQRLVGFHTERWKRNFLRTAGDIAAAETDLGEGTATYRGHRALVTSHPISVDPREFEELAGSEAVLAAEREIEARRPEKLILRVDRTDPSKTSCADSAPSRSPRDASGAAQRPCRGMLTLLDPLAPGHPPSTRSTWARSSARRGRWNDRFQAAPGSRSTCRSANDFRRPSRYKQFDVLLVMRSTTGSTSSPRRPRS